MAPPWQHHPLRYVIHACPRLRPYPPRQGRRPDASVTSGNCTGIINPGQSGGSYNVTYYATQDAATAAAIAVQYDLVIMVVATDSSEGGGEVHLTMGVYCGPPFNSSEGGGRAALF